MINLMKCSPIKQREIPVLSGSTVGEEGMALVGVMSGGVEYVLPSNGSAGSVFYGTSVSDTEDIATKAMMEELTIPSESPFTLQLAHTNIVGASDSAAQIRVTRTDGTAMTAQANTGAVNATNRFHVNRSTGVVTFYTDDAGVDVLIYYRYYTTVAEVKSVDWQRSVNNSAGAELAQVGVMQGGYVETNMFDITKNYTAADGDPPVEVTAGANGLFSSDLGGLSLAAVGVVVKAPTTDNPMIGIRFTNSGPVVLS